MALTTGFRNSTVGVTRRYNSIQISEMFDGIVTPGVMAQWGTLFAPTANDTLNISIDTGRAWFNHMWIKNDAPLNIPFTSANAILDRIDAVCIHINDSINVQSAWFVVKEGTPSSSPVKPEFLNNDDTYEYEYPLFYVYRKAASSGIVDTDITTAIGTDTPISHNLLEHMDISVFVKKMDSIFNEWFSNLKNQLDENQASNLQNQINELNEKISSDSDIEPMDEYRIGGL